MTWGKSTSFDKFRMSGYKAEIAKFILRRFINEGLRMTWGNPAPFDRLRVSGGKRPRDSRYKAEIATSPFPHGKDSSR